ncbi:hypothetical protein ACOSQ2_018127 [Xanthoceras sorbifolium]
MGAHLMFIDDNIWMTIEGGCTPPTVISEDGLEIPEPKSQWMATEFKQSKWNAKSMNTLFCLLDQTQYKFIINCIAKQVWDILQTTQEDALVVRRTKIQMLINQFVALRMREDETVIEFDMQLMDITI